MFEKLNPFAGPSSTSGISELRIYPIKSCRGISVKKSFLTKTGLELDRRWMFVDAETLKWGISSLFIPPLITFGGRHLVVAAHMPPQG
jgi:uncharacterized protein YcbX